MNKNWTKSMQRNGKGTYNNNNNRSYGSELGACRGTERVPTTTTTMGHMEVN